MSDSTGVAVGALIVAKRSVQTVIKLLDERSWRKKRAGISRLDGEKMAIPLGPDGARALNTQNKSLIPAGLIELMTAGQVEWASGMRIGTASLAGAASAGSVRTVPTITASTAVRQQPFTFIELFAGLGGFRLGLAALGGRCVFASEIDPHAAAAYARNFGDDHLYGDITSVPTDAIPAHDILTAGFPCQSFSRAGKQGGLEDDRGDLFHEILRCAMAGRPKAMLLENVPNLLRVDETHAVHTIIGHLTRCGYHCRINVLNAAALVPQHRERLFIVAFRSDLSSASERFQWPRMPTSRPDGMASVRTVLEALPASGPPLDRYRLTASQWQVVRASHEYKKDPSWRLARLRGAARTLRGSYRKSFGRFSEFVELDTRGLVPAMVEGEEDVAGSVEDANGGEDGADEEEGSADEDGAGEEASAHFVSGNAGVATAVQTHDAEAGTVPPAPRFFTERECARLQGFPDTYILEGAKQYHQLGNAVNPLLVRAVGECIVAALDGDHGSVPANCDWGRGGAPSASKRARLDTASSEHGGGTCGTLRRCEDFLCASAINLLRGVTPPLEPSPSETTTQHAEESTTPAVKTSGYGRYGDESMDERRRRVELRKPDALFCMRCVETYSLVAQHHHR